MLWEPHANARKRERKCTQEREGEKTEKPEQWHELLFGDLQRERTNSKNTSPAKTHSISPFAHTKFPPPSYKKSIQQPGFWERLFGAFLGYTLTALGIQRSVLGIPIPITEEHLWHPALQGKRGPKGQKKPWGGNKSAREKRACLGAEKTPPSQTKGPWTRRVRGSLRPSGRQSMPSKSQKGGG